MEDEILNQYFVNIKLPLMEVVIRIMKNFGIDLHFVTSIENGKTEIALLGKNLIF